MVPSLLHPD